jgi:hypothetical protein
MKKLTPFLLAFAATAPAHAEIKSQSEIGFVSGHSAEVLAKPDDVWKRLIAPKNWWSSSHSWFGKAEGMYIDAQAGGCFCETAQTSTAEGETRIRGSVEHMRVIFADPGKVLRMQGALGPLQSEAVIGTLTIAMEPLKDGAGTKLSFNYTVGGYTRFPMDKMSAAVDAVLAEQFASLIKPLGKIAGAQPKADAAQPKADAAKKKEEWSLDPATLEDKPSDKTKAADSKTVSDKPKTSVEEKPAAEKPKPAPEKPKTSVDEKLVAEKPKPAPTPDPAVSSDK